MDKFYLKLADYIKEKRIDKNMTQEDLAKKLNVKRSTYANWEQGSRKIDVNNVMSICDILDIDMVELTKEMKKYL